MHDHSECIFAGCSNDRETDRPFPEPAMFLLNEDGLLHMADYSNSPFCHPDIRILIEGAH